MNLINRLSGFISSLITLLVPVALVFGLYELTLDTKTNVTHLTFAVGVLAALFAADRLSLKLTHDTTVRDGATVS